MPAFHNPTSVHVDPGGGSGGPVAAAVVVVAIGVAAVAIWRWLAEPHVALEEVLYGVVGFVAVASIAVVAIALRRELRQVPLRPKVHRLEAPARPAIVQQATRIPVVAPRPVHQVIVNSQPPAIVQQHLHLHGVTAADVAEAIAARQAPLFGTTATEYQAIEEKK